jgi:peptide/nickel transport system permease protein
MNTDQRREGVGRFGPGYRFRWAQAIIRLRRFPIVAGTILSLILLMGLIGPYVAPHNPRGGELKDSLLPPVWLDGGSGEYLLGTDRFGRDMFSRLVAGARISLMVSFSTVLAAAAIGTVLGIAAAQFGGIVDSLIMRVVDILLGFPLILIAIVVAVVLGPSLQNVILLIAFTVWGGYARLIRGEVLSIRERDFVAAARICGAPWHRIMFVHLFPNIVPILTVLATLQLGNIIILESSLSFLGVGIPPPTPAWGLMISDGRDYVVDAWWISVVPGVAILLTVMSMNLFGDWLRDTVDPFQRQVRL